VHSYSLVSGVPDCRRLLDAPAPGSGVTTEDVQSRADPAFVILPARNGRFSEARLRLARDVLL
jgi:hypothetical protein